MNDRPYSVGKRMLLFTGFFSCLLILALTLHFYFGMYPHLQESSKSFLQEKNRSLNNFIEAYFNEMIHTLQMLASYPELLPSASGSKENPQLVVQYLSAVKKFNTHVYRVYSIYQDGTILAPDSMPKNNGSIQNFSWYLERLPQLQQQDLFIGFLQQDPSSGDALLSLLHRLIHPEYGFVGLLVIDSRVENIVDQLKFRSSFYTSSYSFILDKNLICLAHPRQELIGVHFLDTVKLRSAFGKSLFFNYDFEGIRKIAYASYLENSGWYLVTTVNEEELFSPIIKIMLLYVLEIIVLVLIFSVIFYYFWNHEILEPLRSLREYVYTVIHNDSLVESGITLSLPNHEIGQIAQYIGKLTSQSLYQKNQELLEKNKLLESLAIHDFLTGLFNRRKIEELLKTEYERCVRYNTSLSLILYDIDFFKNVNDSYGHQEGDRVLKELTLLISHNIRKTDMHGRWGGEEFLVILPETPISVVQEVAEKLRKVVESHDFELPQHITISAGVTVVQTDETLDKVLQRLDSALYMAKKTGRNRVHAEWPENGYV